jgi:hemolysin III
MNAKISLEEQLNTISHAIGACLGIAGLIVLIIFQNNSEWSLFSVLFYGISVVILFSASTLYHAAKSERIKHRYRILDHISIYVLIAGTYTPVSLLLLGDSKGWLLFWLVWSIAAFGVFLKLFFTGRFEFLSVALYLIMGWLIVFDYSTLSERIADNGLLLLFAGGLFYTLGIIFYAIEKIPFNHFIWHLFVLGGAICHYFMIFLYVI